MCNGIAILVWEENGRIKTLCNGEKSHDVLCKENENLRLGKIEPYRFELYYPCSVVFDRSSRKLPLLSGLCGEQPPEKIFNAALEAGRPFFMKHDKKQLEHANLESANLKGANLESTDLRSANLIDADLRSANLIDANLECADLRSADLISANLTGANLKDANLRYADLRGANLESANLIDADLRSADLRSADFRGADMENAVLDGVVTDEFTILPKKNLKR